MNCKIVGKSKEGKQKIKLLGSVWKIVDKQTNIILIKSLCGKDLMWVDLRNDINFIIIECDGY
jgi:hypothetical protein